MCGIIVASRVLEKKDIKESLRKIHKRGPDQEKILIQDGYTFMFSRLAIMGLTVEGMQPFSYKGNILVTNGEIYNYEDIKKSLISKYDFKSGSDCEVLLPLYDELGVDMFSTLDAEFAIVLYDKAKNTLVAGRDPLGIRPLFYGYLKSSNKIVFSSEVKAISHLVDFAHPFPPGHYYIDGKFIEFQNITNIENFSNDTLQDTIENIRIKLEHAIIKRLDSDAPIGFLLSGGLDSSIVCSVAQKHLGKKIKTFSIGMDTDPIDLKYAKVVSDYLGTDHTEVIMNKEDVLNCIEEVIYSLESYDITTIRASIGMYIISKYINENTDVKVLMTGEVSDELFGYKYTDYAPSPIEFQKECKKRIDEIYQYDVLRADRCLASNSLEARVPFGDIDFAKYVMSINPMVKMNVYSMGKYLLRKAFEGEYLPKDILYRDKAAFSDAVGHSMVDYIKEYANNYYSEADFKKKITQYKNPTPFTKESLLYRELFEKHYPNHSYLVKDYWMPNKTWDGCNVDDPSARVLKNYGDSGK